jgi:hypothetical protein
LNFRRLAAHAQEHNYHVSIATIPLDTWLANPLTLSIFRKNAARLSLLAHGNDHLKEELAASNSSIGSVDILAQALRRMARLERHRGVEVCRVMEAPHAALAEETLRGMRQLEYEGVLATPELLLRYNPKTTWPATLGLERSNLLVGGLPAVPRIKMTREWKSGVRLAAVLEQPIVLVGHHADAAKGMGLLADFAQTVNSVGKVKWVSPSGILRSNYKQLRDGDSAHVRMYSQRINYTVPEGVRAIWVHRPWISENDSDEILDVRCAGKQHGPANLHCRVAGPFEVQPGETVGVASLLKSPLDYRTAPAPTFKVWPAFRKVLAEFRDRTLPLRPGKAVPGAGFDTFEKPASELNPVLTSSSQET